MVKPLRSTDSRVHHSGYSPGQCWETALSLHAVAAQKQSAMGFGTCVRDILLLLLHRVKHSTEDTEKKQRLEKGAEQEIRGIKI